ncbi:MAG: phosphoribosylanthranilate isomerase [Verrucomicrobia bacterium]|nr:phosphoribosylanthranilate isomerase [Verrucomicrobiota bacterium]MBU1908759.1 phosphoribosylanthranilate isomerase [Verrucomicrobiota bacterium]
MSLFVKICGLCSESDVRAVAGLGPDAMGFVFWPGSKRAVVPADVAAWTRDLPPGILKVGVFVDASPEELEQTVREAGLDVVQLHFFQCLEKARENFPMIGKKIQNFSKHWKVVYLDQSEPGTEETAFVDAFLVDHYSAVSPGGTGQVADWAAARDFVRRCAKPVVLAGGLTPDNVAEAIRAVRPWGVDVSSGVELSPGRKDLKKVERFIKICRENA